MIISPLLQAGDTVALVAPGKKTPREELSFAIRLFQSWGLIVWSGNNIFNNVHPYLSGYDEERSDDLQEAINNPSVKCIFCARGGYGTTRILDQLDFTPLQTNPKWIVGFSDITALHLQLFKLGIASIHGIMPALFFKPGAEESVNSLHEILFQRASPLFGERSQHNRFGAGEGPVIGGTLSLLTDSLGTRSEPDTKGCILVIEEIDEHSYKVDRMLTQLDRAGKLKDLAGLIVGHFTSIHDSETHFEKNPEDLIGRIIRKYKYPVAFGFPIGHDNPNLAWMHGARASLNVSREMTSLRPSQQVNNK